jgi:hypothetical protein
MEIVRIMMILLAEIEMSTRQDTEAPAGLGTMQMEI